MFLIHIREFSFRSVHVNLDVYGFIVPLQLRDKDALRLFYVDGRRSVVGGKVPCGCHILRHVQTVKLVRHEYGEQTQVVRRGNIRAANVIYGSTFVLPMVQRVALIEERAVGGDYKGVTLLHKFSSGRRTHRLLSAAICDVVSGFLLKVKHEVTMVGDVEFHLITSVKAVCQFLIRRCCLLQRKHRLVVAGGVAP